MTRLLPVLGAASTLCAVLLATGCGSGSAAKVASHPHPHPAPPTVRSLVAVRKSAADRIAEGLIRSVVLPPDARPLSAASGNDVAGNINFGVNIFTRFAYRHIFWRARSSEAAILAFLRHHAPAGFTVESAGFGATGQYDGVAFAGRPVAGRIPDRILVSVVPNGRDTVIRVDAGVAWTYPRSPREVVPPAVREIDIRSGLIQPYLRRQGARPVALRVTDPREVARIVRWFNALNVVQPDTYVLGCPVVLEVPMSFVFRSASGRVLASAIVPSVAAGTCDAIQFTLRGKQQTPLVDSTPEAGAAFFQRVERLLHVRFGPPGER